MYYSSKVHMDRLLQRIVSKKSDNQAQKSQGKEMNLRRGGLLKRVAGAEKTY